MTPKRPLAIPAKSAVPISMCDLHWAAGFIEGEGCFYHITSVPCIAVAQKHIQSLEKLQRLFGGNIRIQKAPKTGFGGPLFTWRLYRGAAGVMMTLYSLMSPYRQEKIKEALGAWKTVPSRGPWRRTCS